MNESAVLKHVLGQVVAAEGHLRTYGPAEIDWLGRASQAARSLVPWLCLHGPSLQGCVERKLNATARIDSLLGELAREYHTEVRFQRLSDLIGEQSHLVDRVGGDVISRVIGRFLVSQFPNGGLAENGASDYPDLYLSNSDYTQLPKYTRSVGCVYAACVKSAKRRPARVPDGLELKTSSPGKRIDCHAPHMGMHLVVTHQRSGGAVVVKDILIAFLSPDDYRESERNTEATTVKYSFRLDSFVSIL